MTEFIGRSEELSILNEIYRSERPSACAVYGRHKVGKTALVRKFCEDKSSVILTCVGGTLPKTFEAFSAQLRERIPSCPDVENFHELLACLNKLNSLRRTVVVLDNYQDLTELDPDVPLELRRFLTKDIHNMNVMMIVCSASIRDMIAETEDRMMPLYGKFVSAIKLRPLPYRDARLFHPDMTEADRIRMYCISGGMPLYHILFSESTAKENIRKYILGPVPFFGSMVENSISEIASNKSSARIMSVLADGPASLKELSDETGFTGAAIMKAMESLVQYDVVRKERAIGGKRDPMYRITDGALIFHYRIIQPNPQTVSDPDTELSYLMLEEEMEMSYRTMFEEICKQYILKNYYCLEIGRWWDRSGELDDVDIIARVLIGKEESTLLCECGFYDRPTRMSDLDVLRDSREGIRDIGNTRYVMFSRSGFTDDLKAFAEDFPTERIELVDIETLH